MVDAVAVFMPLPVPLDMCAVLEHLRIAKRRVYFAALICARPYADTQLATPATVDTGICADAAVPPCVTAEATTQTEHAVHALVLAIDAIDAIMDTVVEATHPNLDPKLCMEVRNLRRTLRLVGRAVRTFKFGRPTAAFDQHEPEIMYFTVSHATMESRHKLVLLGQRTVRAFATLALYEVMQDEWDPRLFGVRPVMTQSPLIRLLYDVDAQDYTAMMQGEVFSNWWSANADQGVTESRAWDDEQM